MISQSSDYRSPFIVFEILDSADISASIQSRQTITRSAVSSKPYWKLSRPCLVICSLDGQSITSIASKTSYPGVGRLSFILIFSIF